MIGIAYFAPYIDGSGLHMPTYEDRLQDLLAAYRSIFGQEAELSPAVPDYQLLSVLAKALDDTSALVLSAYNARNPAYAAGQALDLLLRQAGLSRLPGETDAEARNRMKLALAGRGGTVAEGILAAVLAVPAVEQAILRVNDTDAAVDSIPAHTLALVAQGGSLQAIAEALFMAKPPGIGTWGNKTRQVTDSFGNVHNVSFSRPNTALLTLQITVKAYAGFDQAQVLEAMRTAGVDYVNVQKNIGDPLIIPQLYGVLYQAAAPWASTFAITDIVGICALTTSREMIPGEWNRKITLMHDSGFDFTGEH